MFSSLTMYLQWNTKKSLHYRENNDIFWNFPFSTTYKIFIIQIETVKISHIIILYNINT